MSFSTCPELVVGVKLTDIARTSNAVVDQTLYHEKTVKPYTKSVSTKVVHFNGKTLLYKEFIKSLRLDKTDDYDDEEDDEEDEGGLPYKHHPDEVDGLTVHRTHSEGGWLNGFLGIATECESEDGVGEVGSCLKVDVAELTGLLNKVERLLKDRGIDVKPAVYAYVYESY